MVKIINNYWIWLILGLALVIRLPLLTGSFWLDEAAQAMESARPFAQQLDIAFDFQPPLLHFITHFALKFSRQEWWLRTLGALIPGLITIWATYKLGEQLRNKATGLLAALLLATSSFHIFYSQELRPYSLPAMWASLSWLVLIKLNQDKPDKSLFIFSGLTLLGLYTSYLYPFLLLAQIGYMLLFHPKLSSQFLSASLLWLFGFLIWLPRFWTQLQVGGLVRAQLPGWDQVVSATQFQALALITGKFIFGVSDLEINLKFGLISFLVLACLTYLGLQSMEWSTRKRQPIMILLIWLMLPIISAWLVSFWIPILSPKRVLFALPAFYLLAATLITSSARPHFTIIGRATAWFLTALLLALNSFSTGAYFTSPQLQREDWRSLHQQIVGQYPHNSIVVTSFPDNFAPWIWYDDGSYPTVATGQLSIDLVEDLSATIKPINDYQYVLVFDYLRDLTDPQDKLLFEIRQFGYQEVGVFDQPGIGFVRIYARKNTLLTQHNL